MNVNLAARLACVAIGASFLPSSISRSAVLFARHGPDAGPAIYVVATIPIVALDQSSDRDPSIFFARALISVIYIAIGTP